MAQAQRIARAGTIECSKEPVAGRVYLAAAETGEFGAHKLW